MEPFQCGQDSGDCGSGVLEGTGFSSHSTDSAQWMAGKESFEMEASGFCCSLVLDMLALLGGQPSSALTPQILGMLALLRWPALPES